MKGVIAFVCFTFLIASINASLKLRRQIAGGEDAHVESIPYQASIRVKGEHICGGTILSERHVLTAAHCFSPHDEDIIPPHYAHVTVHVGTDNSEETGQTHRVAKIIIHPEWFESNASLNNDLAIIVVQGRIIFDRKKQKIELPYHNIVSGMVGIVTGWGAIKPETHSPHSIQLQKLKVKLLTASECQERLPSSVRIAKNQFCAYNTPGHGSCEGDSGGPLVVNNRIVGIVSWVYKRKCASGLPEVYTNVYDHINFIRSTMNK